MLTQSNCFYAMSFFFQAEDGIRDWSVTGVQTCALPISLVRAAADDDAVGLEIAFPADLARFSHAAQVRARGDPRGGKDLLLRAGRGEDQVHIFDRRLRLRHRDHFHRQLLRGARAKAFPPLDVAAGDDDLRYLSDGGDALDEPGRVPADAEEPDGARVVPRHVARGERDRRRRAERAERIRPEPEQPAALGI